MKVIQVLPNITYGDGVSNDCLGIYRILKEAGYETAIYAAHIGKNLPSGVIFPIEKMGAIQEDDIVIYHLSTGNPLNFSLGGMNVKKILRYHNITPGYFFGPYNQAAQKECDYGRAGLRYLVDKVDYCLTDSDYNGSELERCGFQCPIETMPIALDFKDYDQSPDEELVKKYSDGIKNIIFTGRIAPNKCQQDVIKAFYFYKKYYEQDARLFLVGSWKGMEAYYNKLLDYTERLGVKDVYFTGHVPFSHILAYYHLADAFVCMSEHEGFCIPLVEAMYFQVPIIAYDSSAVGETLGESGILLKEKDALLTAACVDAVCKEEETREWMKKTQRKQLRRFLRAGTSEKLLAIIDVLGGC